ncbi:MAG: aldose epimerase family protein [Candidatus Limivicinus sp.]|nr:aldose epimerase family protein [Candidatus Limivicinus sp.]
MTEKSFFGRTKDGRQVCLYKLTNSKGASVTLSDYGARIVSLCVPDRNGVLDDVTLGYADIASYEQNNGYFGAVVGRCANRLRNASFQLNGRRYALPANNMGVNTLHGGFNGFDKKVWDAQSSEMSVRFSCFSADGEEGFPGNLQVSVEYRFTDENELQLSYEAKSDQDTLVNLTNHAYFNLDGHKGEKASRQILTIDADFYTPVNQYLQLTGEVLSVAGTVFDFRRPHRIDLFIDDAHPQLRIAGGYDHTFVMRKSERGAFERAAELYSPASGRYMEVYTTQPGMQFYSGNNITCREGKNGAVYEKRQGICLETHSFPDAMANPHFPSPILRAGESFRQVTSYKFGVRE